MVWPLLTRTLLTLQSQTWTLLPALPPLLPLHVALPRARPSSGWLLLLALHPKHLSVRSGEAGAAVVPDRSPARCCACW